MFALLWQTASVWFNLWPKDGLTHKISLKCPARQEVIGITRVLLDTSNPALLISWSYWGHRAVKQGDHSSKFVTICGCFFVVYLDHLRLSHSCLRQPNSVNSWIFRPRFGAVVLFGAIFWSISIVFPPPHRLHHHILVNPQLHLFCSMFVYFCAQKLQRPGAH